MTIKFTHEAVTKGYSFLAGEVHRFPEGIGELIILEGVAFRVCEKAVDQKALEALKNANTRDRGDR